MAFPSMGRKGGKINAKDSINFYYICGFVFCSDCSWFLVDGKRRLRIGSRYEKKRTGRWGIYAFYVLPRS